jgi:hypothetical protein
MVEEGWTVEQAIEAQNEFEAANPGAPRGPLYRWQSLQDLERARERYEAGDLPELLHAIYLCALDNLPIPDWADRAFRRAYTKGVHGELDGGTPKKQVSWAEVFGRPCTKAGHKAFLRDINGPRRIWSLVVDAKLDGPESIDNDLFQRIGARLGMCRTRVTELYKIARREYGPIETRVEKLKNLTGAKKS